MSDLDLVELDRLYAAATQGDWKVTCNLGYWIEPKIVADVDAFNGIAHCGDISWPGFQQKQKEWEANSRHIAALHNAYPAITAELTELRTLLEMAQPFVAAQAGAEHMLEGFGPRKRRPIDALLERVNAAILGEINAADELKDQAAEITRLTDELAEMQAIFDSRWNADMRAILLWQQETNRTQTWPDHADLVVWLLGQLESAKQINVAATEIADAAARVDIECNLPPVTDFVSGAMACTWYDTRYDAHAKCLIQHLKYLESRNLIERKAGEEHLVRFK